MAESTEKIIELPANIVVRDLASELGVSSIQIIKVLMANGVMANINQLIDFETAGVVASVTRPAPPAAPRTGRSRAAARRSRG